MLCKRKWVTGKVNKTCSEYDMKISQVNVGQEQNNCIYTYLRNDYIRQLHVVYMYILIYIYIILYRYMVRVYIYIYIYIHNYTDV